MSAALPNPANCCNQCDADTTTVVNIPGPQGEQGPSGDDGCTGSNNWTDTTNNFAQPASNGEENVDVGTTDWMGVGQPVFCETGGIYEVVSRNSATQVRLKNLGYTQNAAPATNIPAGSRISGSGFNGADGASASGDLLAANNLSDLIAPTTTAVDNLGATTVGKAIFQGTNPSAITFLRVNADNSITFRSAANFRIDISAQLLDTFLTSIAALGTAANKMIYTTGVDTAAETDLTAYARTLLDDTTEILARATLGKVLPRYGRIGTASAVDLNVALSDNAITMEATRYRIDKVVVENSSLSVTTATAGVFTAAGGAGTAIANDQSLAVLTASTKFLDLTLQAVAGTDTFTSGTLFFRVGTLQGAAATGNVHIFGWRYD